MQIVESYPLAVFLCMITMVCWGSWANTQKLATQDWPFQLFYWDYSVGVLLLTLLLAFTCGSSGQYGRPFMEDLSQANGNSLVLAISGGVVFNLANILLVAAIDLAGMAVAFPIGIGLALVLGVITNYFAVPIGNPWLLFAGVAFIVGAVLLSARAYSRLSTAEGITATKGIIVSVVAGILMGGFYRFVAASMSEDFRSLDSGKLGPYTALVVFAIGLILSNLVFNSVVMAKPFKGDPVSYRDYFLHGTPRLHLIGIVGGAIWGLGMSLSILASSAAGFAISYGLGQGATLVAAFWGVFVWKEFRGAPKGTTSVLTLMFASFFVGLSLIVVARVA